MLLWPGWLAGRVGLFDGARARAGRRSWAGRGGQLQACACCAPTHRAHALAVLGAGGGGAALLRWRACVGQREGWLVWPERCAGQPACHAAVPHPAMPHSRSLRLLPPLATRLPALQPPARSLPFSPPPAPCAARSRSRPRPWCRSAWSAARACRRCPPRRAAGRVRGWDGRRGREERGRVTGGRWVGVKQGRQGAAGGGQRGNGQAAGLLMARGLRARAGRAVERGGPPPMRPHLAQRDGALPHVRVLHQAAVGRGQGWGGARWVPRGPGQGVGGGPAQHGSASRPGMNGACSGEARVGLVAPRPQAPRPCRSPPSPRSRAPSLPQAVPPPSPGIALAALTGCARTAWNSAAHTGPSPLSCPGRPRTGCGRTRGTRSRRRGPRC